MPYFAPIGQKRPRIWLFKASLISLLILGSPIYAHASIIVSNANGTTTDDGLITANPSGVNLYYNSQSPDFTNNCSTGSRPFSGCSFAITNFVSPVLWSPFPNATSTVQLLLDSYPTGYPITFYYCVDAIGSYPTACAPWVQITVNSAFTGSHSVNIAGGSGDTRIDIVSPYSGAPVSSTSPITLEASGFINPTDGILTNVDETTGIQVRWTLNSKAAQVTNCIDVICAFNQANTGRTYYSGTGYGVFGSQTFSVSSTTGINLPPDIYTMTTSIIRPASFFGYTNIFGFSVGTDILVSTTTNFTVGSTTLTQELINSNAASWIIGATTTQAFASSCNFVTLSFSVNDCLLYLFLPNQTDIQSLISFAQTNILSRAPWGYASRLLQIITNSASSTAPTALPTFTFTFPTGSPLAADPITINMQEMLDNGSTTLNGVVDPISGKGVKEITEPYIELFIAISALIIMYHDIMGMGRYNNKYADK